MQRSELSRADSKVLAQVFDPESSPTKAQIVVDSNLPADRQVKEAHLLADLRAREKEIIRLIEVYECSPVHSMRSKDEVFREALRKLDQLIAEHPDYASAFNNRAQLRRWRFGDRDLLIQSRDAQDQEVTIAGLATVQDLEDAIRLASPDGRTEAVSPSQGNLLGQAYTQLGAIYLAASKTLRASLEEFSASGPYRSWTKDAFEEEASRLFYLGGLYGNEVAKALAVHTNPHAKLCGNIVKEAMRKEFAEA